MDPKNTLVMLQGGHTTLVHDQTPQQIENELRAFKNMRTETLGPEAPCLFYIQTAQRGDNGLCIDADAIVALVAV